MSIARHIHALTLIHARTLKSVLAQEADRPGRIRGGPPERTPPLEERPYVRRWRHRCGECGRVYVRANRRDPCYWCRPQTPYEERLVPPEKAAALEARYEAETRAAEKRAIAAEVRKARSRASKNRDISGHPWAGIRSGKGRTG